MTSLILALVCGASPDPVPAKPLAPVIIKNLPWNTPDPAHEPVVVAAKLEKIASQLKKEFQPSTPDEKNRIARPYGNLNSLVHQHCRDLTPDEIIALTRYLAAKHPQLLPGFSYAIPALAIKKKKIYSEEVAMAFFEESVRRGLIVHVDRLFEPLQKKPTQNFFRNLQLLRPHPYYRMFHDDQIRAILLARTWTGLYPRFYRRENQVTCPPQKVELCWITLDPTRAEGRAHIPSVFHNHFLDYVEQDWRLASLTIPQLNGKTLSYDFMPNDKMIFALPQRSKVDKDVVQKLVRSRWYLKNITSESQPGTNPPPPKSDSRRDQSPPAHDIAPPAKLPPPAKKNPTDSARRPPTKLTPVPVRFHGELKQTKRRIAALRIPIENLAPFDAHIKLTVRAEGAVRWPAQSKLHAMVMKGQTKDVYLYLDPAHIGANTTFVFTVDRMKSQRQVIVTIDKKAIEAKAVQTKNDGRTKK